MSDPTFLRAAELPRRYRIAGTGGLLLVAVSRAPYLLVHGRFFAEEGTVYFAHMQHGSVWFVARQVGYLDAYCNSATWLAARVPLEQAPLVTAWLSLGVIALLVWATLWLPSELLPNAGSRLAAATLLVVGPLAVPQVWLTATNGQTYLGILALLLLFVDPDALGRARFVAISAMLGLAALSGLYAVALTPLFVVRAVRVRNRRTVAMALVVSFGAFVEAVVVLRSFATDSVAPGRGSLGGPGSVARDVAAWHFGTFVFGNSVVVRLRPHTLTLLGLLALCVFASLVAGALVSVLAAVPRRHVAVFLLAAFVLEECLIIFGTRRGAGGRYVVVPIGILLLMAVHALTAARHHWAVGLAGSLCLVTFITGTTVFWTGDPSLLHCVNCPQWQDQVHAWRAGTTSVLRVWPYEGRARWVIHLANPPGAARTGAKSALEDIRKTKELD